MRMTSSNVFEVIFKCRSMKHVLETGRPIGKLRRCRAYGYPALGNTRFHLPLLVRCFRTWYLVGMIVVQKFARCTYEVVGNLFGVFFFFVRFCVRFSSCFLRADPCFRRSGFPFFYCGLSYMFCFVLLFGPLCLIRGTRVDQFLSPVVRSRMRESKRSERGYGTSAVAAAAAKNIPDSFGTREFGTYSSSSSTGTSCCSKFVAR